MKTFTKKQFSQFMKKFSVLAFAVILTSCSTFKKPLESKPLYDVLFGSDYGGGSFQFYEIISEENEFKMLLNDEIIKPYLKADDIKTSNFILVNMGEKNSGGYTLEVDSIQELADKISITLKEVPPSGMATTAITKPYYILKVKSKKPIEIK